MSKPPPPPPCGEAKPGYRAQQEEVGNRTGVRRGKQTGGAEVALGSSFRVLLGCALPEQLEVSPPPISVLPVLKTINPHMSPGLSIM